MRKSFKVTKQYGQRGTETTLPERFEQFSQAKAFVDENLLQDVTLNVQAIYRIYDFDEIQGEYDSTKVDPSTLQTASREEAYGSQGKGSTASFRPTPLNTTPRPPGTPQKWSRDEDEDEKK